MKGVVTLVATTLLALDCGLFYIHNYANDFCTKYDPGNTILKLSDCSISTVYTCLLVITVR